MDSIFLDLPFPRTSELEIRFLVREVTASLSVSEVD